MKLSTTFLAGLTSAAETNDTAIPTLNNLENISSEIISSASINKSSNWKDHWTRKFRNNSDRMRKSFERCGTRDGDAKEEINIEYDTENPCRAINWLMYRFSMWTDRNIASCNGQKNKSHQNKRLQKWKNILNKGHRSRWIKINYS